MKLNTSYFLAFCLLLVSSFAYSTEEGYSSRITGDEITVGSSFYVQDGKFFDLSSGDFVDDDQRIEIRFGVDEREYYGIIGNFTLEVGLKITPFNTSDVALTDVSTTMSITYTSIGLGAGNVDLDFYEIADTYKARIEITSLSLGTIPDNVYIEAISKVDRYYHIDEASVSHTIDAYFIPYTIAGYGTRSLSPVSTVSSPGEIEFVWDYIEGAEEYELEWTWVDDYDQLAGDIAFTLNDFEKNCTRILTKANTYRVPIVFHEGYVLFRVRAVGRWTQTGSVDLTKNYYGKWSTGTGTYNNVADYSDKVRITTSHEPLKNWQYQAVYAEDGKKKEIVSYFDGSLRNRQTVTKLNSNDEAIVGESVYDNQGRAAIQILPTPVGNPALRYYETLNQNASGDVFTHLDFDWDQSGGTCGIAAAPMSTG
ncbi:MAG: hypothetical protein MK078_05985, partial [Crocinitomicaceae bacterium]|nr:hypothetical protein [Crocinitomicaceae bacterium]